VLYFWMEEIAHDGLSATAITSDWDVETVEADFPEFDTDPFEEVGDDPYEMQADFDVTDALDEIIQFGEPNYGFMLYFPEGEPPHEAAVLSCDNEQPNGRPKLTITYYTEPSSS
jgi:hypothetical protein